MEKESKQEGVTEEQVKEETSKPVSELASTEEKATSAKIDDEWKRTMQSRTDKAEYALKSTEKELQALRNEREQQRVQTRQKEITDLEGEPDEQAKVRRKHQLEDEVNKLQDLKTKEDGAVQRKYDQAIDLARQHSLSLDDARELMGAETPKEMELLAQLKVVEKGKGLKSPAGSSDFTPDSGISDVGDKRSWTQDEIDNLSSAEWDKHKPEIEKALREGRIK